MSLESYFGPGPLEGVQLLKRLTHQEVALPLRTFFNGTWGCPDFFVKNTHVWYGLAKNGSYQCWET
jgi:hypothetical protein